MLKEWKSKRQLSLFVALALSAGGTLFSGFQSAYAADVTGGNVVIDTGDPDPSTIAAGNIHDIPAATDNRNVTRNKLTVKRPIGANIHACGGYTMGAGTVSYNELEIMNGAYLLNGNYRFFYGGFSEQGKAINNTVTLNGAGQLIYSNYVYGGFSNNPSADVMSGNTLNVISKDNLVYKIKNFEKIKFQLGTGIQSGNTMVSLSNSTDLLDWNKITVEGASDWIADQLAASVTNPSVTLVSGGPLNISNYAPTLIKNVGDREFGKRTNATTIGTVVATSLLFDGGNRFQNATTLNLVGAIACGGYSVYGNTTNHNVIATGTNAYGDIRAGYTNAVKGGSDFNTLNINDGSTTNAYGGYTTGTTASAADLESDPSATADAKNNIVNINGGTLNASGKLYGGYIATNTVLSATSSGNASGNIINIENGTFGGATEIYGGYTNGTGKATGNTVNIGKNDGTFNAPTLSNAVIYGGASSGSASDVVTRNTLNVNTNASARNIANFDKVSFNFNSNFNQTQPMLNITGGAVTNLDWGSISYTGTVPSGHSILMQNMSNISLAHYNGPKVVSLTDTHETAISTNLGTGTAQQIVLDGYQFKGATPTPAMSAPTEDTWAGRSVLGNTTTGNTLTINGTNHRDAYGGWTAGTGTTKAAKDNSTGNIVNLKAGSVHNIYGGYTSAASGNATSNTVTIMGGTMTDVYGGFSTGRGQGGGFY